MDEVYTAHDGVLILYRLTYVYSVDGPVFFRRIVVTQRLILIRGAYDTQPSPSIFVYDNYIGTLPWIFPAYSQTSFQNIIKIH